MGKKSAFDGFYTIGKSSGVPRQVMYDLRAVSYKSRFFGKMVRQAKTNALKFGLKVQKSSMRGAGNGIIHKGTRPIPKKTVIGVFPGKVCVNPDDYADSSYIMNIGNYGYKSPGQRLVRFKSFVIGKGSKNAWDGNNLNHHCNPNCKLRQGYVKGGLAVQVVETIRPVYPGQEIYADYGFDYYRLLSKIKRLPSGCIVRRCRCGHCPQPRGQLVYA